MCDRSHLKQWHHRASRGLIRAETREEAEYLSQEYPDKYATKGMVELHVRFYLREAGGDPIKAEQMIPSDPAMAPGYRQWIADLIWDTER